MCPPLQRHGIERRLAQIPFVRLISHTWVEDKGHRYRIQILGVGTDEKVVRVQVSASPALAVVVVYEFFELIVIGYVIEALLRDRLFEFAIDELIRDERTRGKKEKEKKIRAGKLTMTKVNVRSITARGVSFRAFPAARIILSV